MSQRGGKLLCSRGLGLGGFALENVGIGRVSMIHGFFRLALDGYFRLKHLN